LHAFIIANLLTDDGYLISLIMIVVIVAHFKTEYKCNTQTDKTIEWLTGTPGKNTNQQFYRFANINQLFTSLHFPYTGNNKVE
jgi:hypothetical protein